MMAAVRLKFARTMRLTRKRDFERVFARRCSAADDVLVIHADTNGLAHSRLGLAVSRRIGGAVQRNRIKRRIREAFRTRRQELPPGLDAVCIPKSGRSLDTRAYAESLSRLLPVLRQRLDSRAD